LSLECNLSIYFLQNNYLSPKLKIFFIKKSESIFIFFPTNGIVFLRNRKLLFAIEIVNLFEEMKLVMMSL